jgi:DNA processing protein
MLEEAGSARALLASRTALEGAAPRLFEVAPDQGQLSAAAEAVETWAQHGLRLLTVLDAGYPENLLGVHDRPPFVFIAGQLTRKDRRAVAVIGSRRATADGKAFAAALSRHLAHTGYTVVSGLAAGIDTAAHVAALASGGRTVAVIGTGLGRCFPPENAHLQHRIAAEGAVISQFWPDTAPSRETFPLRNAVMSGISLASVIVEASERSGARIQARIALAHGRPVFLLDELLAQQWARQLAEQPGVHVIRHPEQVTAMVESLTGDGALVP